MAKNFVIAQITDLHIGATWAGDHSIANFASAVAALKRLPLEPDIVLASGDLAEDATAEQYQVVRDALAQIGCPIYPLAGNHDSRVGLREAFGLPGEGEAPIHYSVDLEETRLVVLDTTIPGLASGSLDQDRLAWLDTALAADARPTVLAMHHLPIPISLPAWESIGIPAVERDALASLLRPHVHVGLIVCGHVHRCLTGHLAGRTVVAAPSTYARGRTSLGDKLVFDIARPGFALHVLGTNSVASQFEFADL